MDTNKIRKTFAEKFGTPGRVYASPWRINIKRSLLLLSLFSVFCTMSITKSIAQQVPQDDSLYLKRIDTAEPSHGSRPFLCKDTGIMELELDYSNTFNTEDGWGDRDNAQPVKGRVVIDFSNGVITMFEDRDKEPTTLHFSNHGYLFAVEWTNARITAVYDIYIDTDETDHGRDEKITLVYYKDNQSYIRKSSDQVNAPATRYHISSITRK